MNKDVRYFSHDADARHDPKIIAMMKKYGVEGYGRFWIIVEEMRTQRGQKLSDKSYNMDSLAAQFKCSTEDVKKFMQDCVEEFELFIKEDDFYYSESLIERMSYLKTAIKKKSNAAYVMHEKYGHNITNEPKDDDI
jgi:hypothetical protein